MSTIDIVARLQLRAEQFSSETGARFAEMKTRAQSAAAGIRQEFNGAFSEVQKLAAGALVMPRTAGGSLDLSSEITQLRAAATAADQQAISLRELAVAQMAAANAGRADAAALRLEADASSVGSLAAERSAAATRERIVALEAVQVELNRASSATDRQAAASAQGAVSAGQHKAAMQQLSYQANDVATQFASGTPVMQIFAQQSGQVFQALALLGSGAKTAGAGVAGAAAASDDAGIDVQGFGEQVTGVAEKAGDMGGKLGAVAGFLSGPWGAGLLVAVSVLTPFVAQLFEGNGALDDAVEKLKADAIQTSDTSIAKERFTTTLEGVAAAIREGTEATKASILAEQSSAEQANISAKQALERQLIIRQTTVALLEQAEAEARAANATNFGAAGGAGAGAAQSIYAGRVADYKTMADKAREDLKAAEARVQATRVDLAAEAANRAVDPMARIAKIYDDQVAAAKAKARAEGVVTSELTRQLSAIEKNRQAEIKATQDAARETRKKPASLGTQLETERSASLLASAQSYRGLSETRDKGAIQTLLGSAGVSLDPEKVAWCAAFVNAVLAGKGISGTGSLSARSFLGFGEETNRPAKGDIVVSRRGTGNQGHVGFYEGTDANGNVRVLGGNTGNRVGTQTVARGDVLGFRRAPSAADGYKAEEQAAKRAEKAAQALADLNERAATGIARINTQWDDQPRLIDRARLQTAELDSIIKDLGKRKPAGFEQLVEQAKAAKDLIQSGLTRPFEDYVRAQKESMAVGQLILQGRDAEATALQDALRLMQQQGYVTDDQLATVLDIAQQQERIAEALEDQRAIVGIYSGAVGDLQRKFEDFLGGLRTKPGSALKNLVSGALGTFQKLQDNLLSNALFGGIDRDVEKYVRRMTGKQTPAEILETQAGDAGKQLRGQVGNAATALEDFTRAVRSATGGVGVGAGASPVASLLSADTFAEIMRDAALEMGRAPAANDNDARGLVADPAEDQRVLGELMKAGDVFGVGIDRFVKNLSRLGIDLPKSVADGLKKHIPTVLEGASFGQLGGSVFASITGGKNNSTGSAIGGVLGEIAGKEIGKTVGTAASGLMKSLGGAAGPIGAVVGGVLGNLVGGLFKKKSPSGSVDITGTDAGSATASGKLGSALKGNASAVQKSLTQIAEQLDAVTGAFSVSIGKSGDWYHVAGSAGADVSAAHPKSPLIYEGKDEAAAVQAAVLNALQDGAIKGISEAAQRILKSGQDLDVALNKALLIESIPKDLKRMLDPVGAAVDDLNRKWQKTYNALVEGGAGAEQMAEAQRLYNLQMAETKSSTKGAADTLRTFLDSFKVGSASPYSLRDQEAAAKAALQPFLDTIAAGGTIDQAKYQDAAQKYLDIERELYGSTDKYFASLDAIQAATNSAIAAIDKAVPITPGVPDPFTKAAADGIKVGNEIADTQTQLLAEQNRLLTALLSAATGGSGGDFIGAARTFLNAA